MVPKLKFHQINPKMRALVNLNVPLIQFVIFKPQSHCFKETIGFDVKASFASRPESSYNEPGDLTRKF